jgi:hypothetical protein
MDSDDEMTRREFLDFCNANDLLTPTAVHVKKKQRVAITSNHEVHNILHADGSFDAEEYFLWDLQYLPCSLAHLHLKK